MNIRIGTRILVIAVACATSGCAHTRNAGTLAGPRVENGAQAEMCDLRVASAYDAPVEAGLRAGSHELSLGTLAPDEVVELQVSCAYRAITVFRVVDGGHRRSRVRLDPRAHALDPGRVTTVTVRPPMARGHVRLGG